jgi:hypothetical protein
MRSYRPHRLAIASLIGVIIASFDVAPKTCFIASRCSRPAPVRALGEAVSTFGQRLLVRAYIIHGE